MGQHIKTYPTDEELKEKYGELDDPSVYYSEASGIAWFGSQAHISEESLSGYYQSLLENLAQRVTELENGKNVGVFLLSSEYEKLINTGIAVDEDGNIITYDSGATYYTYDSDEPESSDTSGSVEPGSTILKLTNATVNEDTHTLSIVGGNIKDGMLIFTASKSASGGTVTDKTLVTPATVSNETLLMSSSSVIDTILKL